MGICGIIEKKNFKYAAFPFKTKSDQNIHQNAQNSTIFQSFLGRGCPRTPLKQDAREAMRVVFSVLTKRICMHKTTFARINSNIVLKVILNCMNMQIATQLIMMYNL